MVNDRAFESGIRKKFYYSILFLLILVATDVSLCFAEHEGLMNIALPARAIRGIFRPLIEVMYLYILVRDQDWWIKIMLPLPAVLNGALFVMNIWTGCMFTYEKGQFVSGTLFVTTYLIHGFYLGLIIFCALFGKKKDGWVESFFVIIVCSICLGSAFIERIYGMAILFDNVLGVGICAYYYLIAMQVYRRDALTNLLSRHNMYFDMENLDHKKYMLTVVDVDNFKIINDKYGHQTGDQVLVDVVHIIQKNLLLGSKMYRFGGDEFTILSYRVDEAELEKAFSQIDKELEEKDYSISYGNAIHEPGDKIIDVIDRADADMYRNKRAAKSEDIWDVMTGLFNLRGFLDELESLKKHALSEKEDICLISFDIDHLKNINSAYGLVEGNLVIITLAKVIESCIGVGQFIGHLGSDEYVVAMQTAYGDEEEPQNFIDKVLKAIDETMAFSGKDYTVEINYATYHLELTQESILDTAVDKVLYAKKTIKENRRKNMPSGEFMDDKEYSEEDQRMVMDIIDHNKLKYAFQPIISAKDGKVVAYEALMRSDTEPMVSPLKILNYATKNKRLYDVEKVTLNNVLGHIKEHVEELKDKRVFLNSIPGFSLNEEDYGELSANYHDIMDRVVFEITEQEELADKALEQLRERSQKDQFKIAIDDFGSGCSNTNSLLRYMPEVIKLDRLLITDISKNAKKQYFVNSITTFAKANAMIVLAEGVETLDELKTVIHLGVDLIQGFYTAQPSYEFTDVISEEIKNAIITENMRTSVNVNRKVYIASTEREISLVHLALEEYTGVTIAVPTLKVLGNSDYRADMCLKIKEGLECRITLKDVNLSSIDNQPCIDIGEGARVTLVIEGKNTLDARGIHVPEGSSLTIEGNGVLDILAKGHKCYGIGAKYDESFGNIRLTHSGEVKVRVDGEEGVAIGGGIYHEGYGIIMESGILRVYAAAVDAVGIGCVRGDVPIRLKDSYIFVDFRVNTGTAIGSVYGKQDIHLENFKLEMSGSGSSLSAIGTNHSTGGIISMLRGSVVTKFTGQNIVMFGGKSGEIEIRIEHIRVDIFGEGNSVLAIGCIDHSAKLHMDHSPTKILINASEVIAFGAMEDNFFLGYQEPDVLINGNQIAYSLSEN